MKIFDYITGKFIGCADVDDEFYDRIALWPQGTIDAFSLLSSEDLKLLNIEPKTIIFCED